MNQPPYPGQPHNPQWQGGRPPQQQWQQPQQPPQGQWQQQPPYQPSGYHHSAAAELPLAPIHRRALARLMDNALVAVFGFALVLPVA